MPILGRSYSRSALRPPAIVGPPVVYGAVTVKLTPRPVQLAYRQPRHSKLGAPQAVTAAAVAPTLEALVWRSKLVRTRPPRTSSRLGPPTVIGPMAVAFIPPPLRSKLIRIRPPLARSRLGAPTIIGPTVAAFIPPALMITRARPPRAAFRARSRLAPALIPPVVFEAIRRALARRPLAYLFARSKLRPPTAVTAAAVGALSLEEFAPPSPDANTLAGTMSGAELEPGSPDANTLGGTIDAAQFRQPGPRRG